MTWTLETWSGEEDDRYYADVMLGTEEDLVALNKEEEHCCPILMEKLGEAEVDGIPNSRCLRMYDREFVAAKVMCCGKIFHPIALAVHWMLHGMRCPLCRNGSSVHMDVCSLPDSCRDDVMDYVERMRKEMRREEAEEEFDDIDIDIGPLSELMTDITFLRQWDFVYPNLQLQAIIHMSPSLVPQALQSVNRRPFESGSPYWTQCSTGINIFLNVNFEESGIEAPQRFNVQRNQCRKISRTLQSLRPTSISFGLCYAEGSDSLTQIARTNVIHLSGNQSRITGDLSFSTHDHNVRAGAVRLSFIGDGCKSIDGIACEVEADKIISRLVHGRLVAFQHSHGFIQIDSMAGFSISLTA